MKPCIQYVDLLLDLYILRVSSGPNRLPATAKQRNGVCKGRMQEKPGGSFLGSEGTISGAVSHKISSSIVCSYYIIYSQVYIVGSLGDF